MTLATLVMCILAIWVFLKGRQYSLGNGLSSSLSHARVNAGFGGMEHRIENVLFIRNMLNKFELSDIVKSDSPMTSRFRLSASIFVITVKIF
jgi:hypothetical protein